MLVKLEEAKQKWGGSFKAIDSWLDERQQVLVLFTELSRTASRSPSILPQKEMLQSFCQLLVDYVSAGHFEVYEKIVSRCEENGQDSLKLARRLYPKISQTTDELLEFNDKYSVEPLDDGLERFDQDLSRLGESIVTRLELEDKLINTLYTRH